jgi:[ribosomal protein S5]-alanine N-acetyltransferase
MAPPGMDDAREQGISPAVFDTGACPLRRDASLEDAFARVETERLVLRRPEPSDLDALFRVHGDPATWTHSPHAVHTDIAQSDEFLRNWLGHWARRGFGYWAVERDGTVIGFGGLELMANWQGLRDVLNVYYRFAPSAWGKGYATETVAAAVGLARSRLPGTPLVARVRRTNHESARVALRTGFERRADLDEPDLLVYALDWN